MTYVVRTGTQCVPVHYDIGHKGLMPDVRRRDILVDATIGWQRSNLVYAKTLIRVSHVLTHFHPLLFCVARSCRISTHLG